MSNSANCHSLVAIQLKLPRAEIWRREVGKGLEKAHGMQCHTILCLRKRSWRTVPNRVYSEPLDDLSHLVNPDDLSPLVNSYSKLQVIGGNGACFSDKYDFLNYIAHNSNAKQWSTG